MGVGEVVLFMEDIKEFYETTSSHCRICYEEEVESCKNLEAPCACSGTVKFAHRDCLQRWCFEKGNTTCEICLQEYGPGYAAPSKKSQIIEAAVTIRDSLQVRRREHGQRNPRFVAVADGLTEGSQCTSAAHRAATCWRLLALTFAVVLIMKHVFDMLSGKTKDYPFTFLTILLLRASGIVLPMYILKWTITAIHSSIRRQYQVTDYHDMSNSDEEEDEEEEEDDL